MRFVSTVPKYAENGRSGIGLAAAVRYAESGMSIFLSDYNESGLSSAVQTIKAIDGVGEVMSMKVDVSKVAEVEAMREKVLDEFGVVRYDPSCTTSSCCSSIEIVLSPGSYTHEQRRPQ